MAHGISSTDHVATARGIKPWHGLGTTIPRLMSPAQAIEHANLGWRVSLQPLVVRHADFAELPITERAVVRMDTVTKLGIVGERYVPMQNTDLVAILDAVVESGARIDTAGSLLGGRIVWFAALIGSFEAAGDRHDDYLVISHGHDGSRAVTIRHATIRVVCWNTLLAHDRAGTGFFVRHTASAATRIATVGRLLAAGAESRRRFQEAAERLSGRRLGELQQLQFIVKSLGLDPGSELRSMERKIQAAQAALTWERAHASGDADSLWTALQATTHYLAHETASRGAGSEAGRERRFLSVLDGQRARVAAKAYAEAARMAKVL